MRIILFLIPMTISMLPAQGVDVSITAKGTYTTSTRFLYNIDAPAEYFEGDVLESNFGYGIDARWKLLWDRFYLGMSYEKVRSVGQTVLAYTAFNDLRIVREEGFAMTAVEISGYYIVAISSELVHFYLGGGFGLYDGERIYSIAGVSAATTSARSNVGIHVLTGIDYWLTPGFAVRGELKFRDPHFDVVNRFDQSSVNAGGIQIPLPRNEMKTRVNLFGVNYMLGAVVQL